MALKISNYVDPGVATTKEPVRLPLALTEEQWVEVIYAVHTARGELPSRFRELQKLVVEAARKRGIVPGLCDELGRPVDADRPYGREYNPWEHP